MCKRLINTLLLLQTMLCGVVNASELLGKWEFQSSNKELPVKCHKAYLDFVSISKIEGSDGSRKGVIEYSAEKVVAGGYNLIAKHISNDGKQSCYGSEEEPIDNNELVFFYIMLSPDNQLMKFYFSKEYYHVYKRVVPKGTKG